MGIGLALPILPPMAWWLASTWILANREILSIDRPIELRFGERRPARDSSGKCQGLCAVEIDRIYEVLPINGAEPCHKVHLMETTAVCDRILTQIWSCCYQRSL